MHTSYDDAFLAAAGGGGDGKGGGAVMDYDAILSQVLVLLQQQKRLSYRVLQLRLQLDDDTLEALKEDLIYAKHLALDEDGRVLVWAGDIGEGTPTSAGSTQPLKPPDSAAGHDLQVG